MKLAFDQCADAYEEFRPGYPAELFDYLVSRFRIVPGSVAVDVGAGTGRAAWPLAERGCQVYAVEPSAAMRKKGSLLAAGLHGRVTFLDCSAEATAIPDGAADLLIAAQAFHWFDPQKALTEAARVLKPAGGIALFWNNRDADRNPLAQGLDQLISRANPGHEIAYRRHAWDEVLLASGQFENVERKTFYHTLTMTADAMCGLFRSVSYVWNVLDDAAKVLFQRDLRLLIERHHGQDPFPFVYRLEVYAAQRINHQDASLP